MRIILTLVLILFAGVASAQDDRGFLQGMLEDALSDTGRTVRIEGFAGAFSSRATITEITFADDQGVWLSLRDVALQWSRSALLSRRIEIQELSAAEIELSRKPLPVGVRPSDAEATPFALPELPVAVHLDQLKADRITLGAPVLGQLVVMSAQGSIDLEGGAGNADLSLQRVDGQQGQFILSSSYANETRHLRLSLELEEAAGGLAATLLKLPGEPALRLTVQGDNPLTDFDARVALASDGQDRFAGNIQLVETEQAQRFSGQLSGDLAPLFSAEFRPFFGQSAALGFSGVNLPDGTLSLDDLSVQTGAMALTGQARLNADRMPVYLNVDGTIGDGTVVRLPVAGPETTVGAIRLRADFDAERNDNWTAEIAFDDFRRGADQVASGTLTAQGQIQTAPVNAVRGDVTIQVAGIALTDPGLAQALGQTLGAGATIDWQADQPLRVRDLTARGQAFAVTGQGALTDGQIDGSITADLPALARFATIAGRPLDGSARVSAKGTYTPLSGAFDALADLQTRDLKIGDTRADPLLAGPGSVSLDALRDENGTTIRQLSVQTDHASLTFDGALSGAAGDFKLAAALVDLGQLPFGLTGPASLAAAGSWTQDQPLSLGDFRAAGAGATVSGNGQIALHDDDLPASLNLTFDADDLGVFSTLAGRPLGGSAKGTTTLNARLAQLDGTISAQLEGSNLRAGIATLDKLIAGDLTLDVAAERAGKVVSLARLSLAASRITATLAEAVEQSQDVSVRLTDLALLVPELPGPATVEGTLRQLAAAWRVDLSASATAGLTARAEGTLAHDFSDAGLNLSGQAPLALANSFISPNSVTGGADFDLTLRGEPALRSLGGTINISGARAVFPSAFLAIEGLTGQVQMQSGQANLNLQGNSSGGGQLALSGTLGLSTPFAGDLSLQLRQLVLSDPALYQTSLDGGVNVTGPLTGGGRVTGRIEIGPTEVQIPSTGVSAVGEIPENLVHQNASAGVQETRRRAGQIKQEQAGPPANFDLDVTFNAPNRIFVRGRGLDAELGGTLRVSGTTQNVIPVGEFSLIRGRLDILGKRLTMTEGQISLQGELEPFLYLVAETDAGETLVRIVVQGPLSEPSISFQSEPDLPEDEVVSQLLFSRDTQSLSPLQALQLASAVATLAGKGGSLVDGIRSKFGLDDLDLTSDEETGTSVRVGKYLSENVYTGVTVNSLGESKINLNLDLSNTLTAKGAVTNTGESTVGIYWQRDY